MLLQCFREPTSQTFFIYNEVHLELVENKVVGGYPRAAGGSRLKKSQPVARPQTICEGRFLQFRGNLK